ncbi:hypothetical protein PMI07_001402 [Rhizobium sp. CF080]|uniref:hypothetical protein n=1 Tax=Rhizobium sp. (strain CF080) TaxID=1144310 RepID=UPI0003E80255|nr:hypothetical protein [Rhizobium sp. CF080]EUB96503.1 hypothetical protein PMI07_001402 [Rhizobium sp. CF080]
MARHLVRIIGHGVRPLLAALLLLPLLVQASVAGWDYRQTRDEMRGITVSFASVVSDNGAESSWPAGPKRVQLTLRSRNPKDLSVDLTTDSGHFACFDGAAVAVKFDDGPVEDYQCDTPNDGGTQQIFLIDAFGFFAKLKRSGKVTIEPTFFGNGRHQFTFTTAGLGWT